MKTGTVIAVISILIGLMAGPGRALGSTGQVIDNAWQTCARATALEERRAGVPRNLLKAISLAESGRWDESRRENVAWPWTVTAEGKGRYFDTRAEAVAEVEILMTQGVRNIDVGCMQVNLYYHGGAFETLDEAFDPEANATYAAQYLKNMFAATGDWPKAAGHYHSMTPARGEAYREKVMAFWRDEGGAPNPSTAPAQQTARLVMIPAIDHGRMAKLNARFKARREAERSKKLGITEDTPDFAAQRRRQLEAWRDATDRGQGTLHLLAMRKAELALKRKRELDRLGTSDDDLRFTERRKKQLHDWRIKVAGTGQATRIAGAAAGAAVR